MSELSFFIIVAGIAFLAGAVLSSFVATLRKTPTSKEEPRVPNLEPIPKIPQLETTQYPHDAVHLWLDEQRQEVVIKIGSKKYSADDKLSSNEYKYVHAVAVSLERWLDEPAPIAPDLPASYTGVNLEDPAELNSDQGDSDDVDSFENASIVEQINHTLQQKLAASSQKNKSVMLMEMANQGVVVIVGADQYPDVDSVPDPEIKAIIQAAVNDWESQV